jgi:hypothetical protein
MAQEVSVIVRDDDRARLEAIIGDRSQRRKHVQRAQIVVLSAARLAVAEVARQARMSRPAVWRWQRRFAEQGVSGLLRDIVGLYIDPPAHSLVLSLHEKSQIQELDRAQPGLPLKPGKAGTWTQDYKRHGTTTLFAALNVLDGRVVGRCMARHGPGAYPLAPTLDLPLHAALRLLAERGRVVLLDAHPPAAEARCIPLHRRAAGGHQPLPRRAQSDSSAVHLDPLR